MRGALEPIVSELNFGTMEHQPYVQTGEDGTPAEVAIPIEEAASSEKEPAGR